MSVSTLTHWMTIIALSFYAVSGQYSLNLRISEPRVKEGAKLNATCRVFNHLDSAVLLYWVKRVGTEEIDIASGPQLSEMFRKTGRYRVEQEAVKPLTEFKFTLYIDEAKAEDSGEIGCRIPNQNIEVFKKLTVVSQVQSVKLSSKDLDNSHAVIYTNGDKATFNEGEVHKFNCHVNGSYPKPNVEIYIGDQNITSLFKEKFEEVNEGITRGRYYRVDLYNDRLHIDYKFSGKNLTCTARVHEPTTGRGSDQGEPGLDPNQVMYPPVSTSVGIFLKEYRPKFLCGESFSASVHDRNVALECPLQAEPAVTGARFVYTVLGAMNETVRHNSTFGRYRGLLVDTLDNRQKAVLKIDMVFPQHFRKYYFEATNAVGSTIHEVELIRIAKSVAPGVGNECCGINLLLLSFISMIVVKFVLN